MRQMVVGWCWGVHAHHHTGTPASGQRSRLERFVLVEWAHVGVQCGGVLLLLLR